MFGRGFDSRRLHFNREHRTDVSGFFYFFNRANAIEILLPLVKALQKPAAHRSKAVLALYQISLENLFSQ